MRGTLPESYWETWLNKDYTSLNPAVSWISLYALQKVADKLGFKEIEGKLARTIARLVEGADTGCRGDGRLPTAKDNSPLTF